MLESVKEKDNPRFRSRGHSEIQIRMKKGKRVSSKNNAGSGRKEKGWFRHNTEYRCFSKGKHPLEAGKGPIGYYEPYILNSDDYLRVIVAICEGSPRIMGVL